jgi:hypothetical protein
MKAIPRRMRYMSIISLIGIIGTITAIAQIFFSETILLLRPLGIKTKEQIVVGGYIGVVVGPLFIVLDIFFLT